MLPLVKCSHPYSLGHVGCVSAEQHVPLHSQDVAWNRVAVFLGYRIMILQVQETENSNFWMFAVQTSVIYDHFKEKKSEIYMKHMKA